MFVDRKNESERKRHRERSKDRMDFVWTRKWKAWVELLFLHLPFQIHSIQNVASGDKGNLQMCLIHLSQITNLNHIVTAHYTHDEMSWDVRRFLFPIGWLFSTIRTAQLSKVQTNGSHWLALKSNSIEINQQKVIAGMSILLLIKYLCGHNLVTQFSKHQRR